MRSAQRPRLPPTIEGDADSNIACRPLKGCGLKRDTQSMTFFNTPGMDELYSGDAMMTASAAFRRRHSSRAPAGTPSSRSTSKSYDGQSNSDIAARSAMPPLSVTTLAASDARRLLSESARSDAPKIRYRTEQ